MTYHQIIAAYTPNTANFPVVNILNGTLTGSVFGGGKGDPSDHSKGKVTGNPQVTIGQAAGKVTIAGDVYGGGDAGDVAGTPVVTIFNNCNNTIANVYGGGNAADVTGTDVTVDGGTIGMVFGGGHGDKDVEPQKEANVNGNVSLIITGGTIDKVFAGSNSKGNITGTTGVTVNKTDGSCDLHITELYGGGNEAAGNAGTISIQNTGTASEGIGTVYGGANNADINSDIVLSITGGNIGDIFGGNNNGGQVKGDITVDINWTGTGVNHVSNVYGGGNIASIDNGTARTVTVNIPNATISGSVFGGGNGKDPEKNANGAQVGYKRNDTSEGGTGVATTKIYGGKVGTWTINEGIESCAVNTGGIFGGSNTNGNIRGRINLLLDEAVCLETDAEPCTLKLKDIYGAGNEAAYVGEGINFTLGCVSFLSEIYGGAKAADLNTDAVLTITSGHFGRVFGGNNISGKLNGKIVVNIDETGCNPVIIDELYGGGNLAAYSVYGYEDALVDGKVVVKTSGSKLYNDPQVNIISCTRIGTVYGGGLGESAVMVGNPTVNIQEVMGLYPKKHYDHVNAQVVDGTTDELGSIGTVFGGGNAAKVVGTTNVNIATVAQNKHIGADDASLTTVGANIIGNVYGGGNQADVTGKTNVVIGR